MPVSGQSTRPFGRWPTGIALGRGQASVRVLGEGRAGRQDWRVNGPRPTGYATGSGGLSDCLPARAVNVNRSGGRLCITVVTLPADSWTELRALSFQPPVQSKCDSLMQLEP